MVGGAAVGDANTLRLARFSLAAQHTARFPAARPLRECNVIRYIVGVGVWAHNFHVSESQRERRGPGMR